MSIERIPTARFVDLDFPRWYHKALPDHLAEQFPNGLQLPEYIDDFEGLDLTGYEKHLTDSLVATHDPRNAYHGWAHGAQFLERAADAYDAIERICGLRVPAGFLQPILIGGALHDVRHPGTTFLSEADKDRIPAGASVDQTVESYSAEVAARAVESAQGTPAQQALAAYVPITTTYGAEEDRGRELNIAAATDPKGISGLISRASDVVPSKGAYAWSGVEDQGLFWCERRPGGKPAPASFDEYCAQREEFLGGYVLSTLDKLDAGVGANVADYLGWRQIARLRFAQTKAMRRGDNTVLRSITLSSLEARYGVVLPLR